MIYTNGTIFKYGIDKYNRKYIGLFIEDGLDIIEKMPEKVSIMIDEPIRSKESNKYLWGYLLPQISNITKHTPKEIYKQFVKDFASTDTEICKVEEIDDKVKKFCKGKYGRFCEVYDTRNENEKEIIYFYSSSDFSTKEFKVFIKCIEEELSNLRKNA